MPPPLTPDTVKVSTVAASPPTAPPLPDESGGPISPEQLAELAEANRRARKVLGAARMATFNGWSAGVLAVLALPFVVTGPTAGVMAVALGVVAFNEFRGRRMLKAFDLRGCRLLGFNQLGLMVVLIGYACWCIYSSLTGPQPYEAEMDRMPELRPMLGSVSDLQRTITLAVYGGLIVGACLFQGLAAVYYFTRRRHVRAYLEQTPEWIVELQRRLPAG